ncbi:MAG: glutamate 5-kinase [Chloroflexi bacterium]|nr:glutamate 5-kinase [Chloroflexota bacterium]MBI5292877.1 glutamate 5-kinase [Chloroflexota bacterium]MBI5829672.1 glutamate 5-kinase [Chloroflexota bacterium]
MKVVVKLGTSTLTAGAARLSPPRLVELARQMAALRSEGHELILVTSGAMAAGREALDFPQLPKDLPAKQMLAAVGQPRLMALYQQLFALYGLTVSQLLLTRADLADRRRYLNSRNTLTALLAHGVLPIVNENDTVATEEIRVGDNDNLSALVANLVDADLLVLLTDQPGLFTADPRLDPAAQLVTDVSTPDIPDSLWRAAGGSPTGLGTGGMVTKLQAADLARRSGAAVVIARGGDTNILSRVVSGEGVGTRFHPVATAVESRKRYILAGGRAAGGITVDSGAARALRHGGSLLAVGVAGVDDAFDRGDTVRVAEPGGREIARGIVNYPAADLLKIRGHRSDEIESLLGYNYGDEVIHRNDLVLL